MTSFTCTAHIFPTESEARALAKERQKKDNHNLSKLVLCSLYWSPCFPLYQKISRHLGGKLVSPVEGTFYGGKLFSGETKVYNFPCILISDQVESHTQTRFQYLEEFVVLFFRGFFFLVRGSLDPHLPKYKLLTLELI